MAFRKNIKKKTIKTTSTKRKKNVVPASHKIDGIVYASKELADFHRTLKGNPVVKDFHLMNVTEEKKYNSGRLSLTVSWKLSITFIFSNKKIMDL